MRQGRKATQHPIAAGEKVKIMTGGGGWGPASARDPEAVRRDYGIEGSSRSICSRACAVGDRRTSLRLPPTPSLGLMLADGRGFMLQAPWMAVFPGLAIMRAVLGFDMLADGLRDWLDPNRGGGIWRE